MPPPQCFSVIARKGPVCGKVILPLILLNLIFMSRPLNAISADIIRINGSGSGLELMKPMIKAYTRQKKGVKFVMERPLGSAGSVKAVLAGALDIAVISSPLKPEDIAAGCILRAYGQTPLAVVTHKGVPLKNISTRELEDIYSGKRTIWSDGERIRIVLRPERDIDTRILKGLSPGMAEAVDIARKRGGMIIAITDPESDKAVSGTPGGIGTGALTGLRAGNWPLNVVALNGVPPSRKNLASGAYRLAKDIGFATAGRLSTPAAQFMNFVYSGKGRAVAEKAGVLVKMNAI